MKIELERVSLWYGGQVVFRDVSLQVEPGEFVRVVGPSGSGKTSLLRLLNRLHEPTAGRVLVDARSIAEYEVTALRRRIGYVQQTPVMVAGTVAENLRFPFRFRAAQEKSAPTSERMRELLDEFLLNDIDLAADATRLSVGQKQRVALLRTLLADPEALLCDEPTSALDAESRQIVHDALERMNVDQGISVVLVTHNDFVARRARPRAYRLVRGEGLREVTP